MTVKSVKTKKQRVEILVGIFIVGFLWLVFGGMFALGKDERPLDKLIVTDTVDMIEWNNVYNRAGKLQIRQMIFWEYKSHLIYTDQLTKEQKRGIDVVVAWKTHIKIRCLDGVDTACFIHLSLKSK